MPAAPESKPEPVLPNPVLPPDVPAPAPTPAPTLEPPDDVALIRQAIELIRQEKKASIRLLQAGLRLGMRARCGSWRGWNGGVWWGRR